MNLFSNHFLAPRQKTIVRLVTSRIPETTIGTPRTGCMVFRTHVPDLDYLAEGDDVEANFLPPPGHFPHDEPLSSLDCRD
ncbi:hypothetical protein AOLI_G00061010 [Acnodon oligacanthus]